jgi:hypothetical protein
MVGSLLSLSVWDTGVSVHAANNSLTLEDTLSMPNSGWPKQISLALHDQNWYEEGLDQNGSGSCITVKALWWDWQRSGAHSGPRNVFECLGQSAMLATANKQNSSNWYVSSNFKLLTTVADTSICWYLPFITPFFLLQSGSALLSFMLQTAYCPSPKLKASISLYILNESELAT